jgi:hypothetical protein
LWAIGRRQQQLDVPAEDVEARVSEHLLRGRIELADVQPRVHRDDRIVRRLQNRALLRFAFGARAIHLVCEVQRRRRQQHRQPVTGAFGHRNDDGRRHRAEEIRRRARREIGLPDAPRALLGRERNRESDRNGVDEEICQRHASERNDDVGAELRMRSTAEELIYLSGALHGDHEDRHVEERAVRRIRRLRFERRLAPAARGAEDHRGVRPAQDQARDVDDVRHRHVRAARDRKMHLEGGRERRQQDQDDQRRPRRERRPREQRAKGDGADSDDRENEPAGARRQIVKQ